MKNEKNQKTAPTTKQPETVGNTKLEDVVGGCAMCGCNMQNCNMPMMRWR